MSIDSNGFIEPSFVHKDGDINIAFLGGSTTEIAYVDEDKRFPYLVGRMLEKKLEKKINSINAGVSGNNTLHSIDILLNKIVPLNMDVVVLMHNINDLAILVHEKTYWNTNPYKAPIKSFKEKPKLTLRSALAYVKNLLIPNIYKAIAYGKPDEFAAFRGKDREYDSKRILDDFKANLTLFVYMCRAYGIKPVLMTQANRYKLMPDVLTVKKDPKLGIAKVYDIPYDKFKTIYDQMNEMVRTVAKKNNILLIDLAVEIPQEREFMYDVVHFNNLGSQKSAEIISKELVQLF